MSVVDKVEYHVGLSAAAVIYSFVMMSHRQHCLNVELNLMTLSTTPTFMGGPKIINGLPRSWRQSKSFR